MHVPDGFLSPQLTIPALGIAAPLWAAAARRHFGPDRVDALPVLGSLTALAFVIQTIMIPLPGGTSAHLVGAALIAIVHGPLAAFVCESLVLSVQALFFGAGGFTVLGVNALALG
ncbi:MAG TPA: energy-coupling factor ABC transporter permease, partial [Anaeromyxobacteraceae bacterium]|nr:energy-coupling factor ABC transporter permease [Anaeromyxobacteraceae bacterium]